jgi:hypothetical protein
MSKGDVRQQSEGLLRDACSTVEAKQHKGVTYGDNTRNPDSPEIRLRRARLIKEINAGWTKESENGLNLIAGQFFLKR